MLITIFLGRLSLIRSIIYYDRRGLPEINCGPLKKQWLPVPTRQGAGEEDEAWFRLPGMGSWQMMLFLQCNSSLSRKGRSRSRLRGTSTSFLLASFGLHGLGVDFPQGLQTYVGIDWVLILGR